MTTIGNLPADHPLRAALDTYGVALEAHRTDYNTWDRGFKSCICGRSFKTPNGRGLHVAAEHKRAGKEFDRATEGWVTQASNHDLRGMDA